MNGGRALDVTQLERFLAIIDAGAHVPRAATTLGVPLASVYTSLEKLEDEVGHPLFTRAKAGWTLTEAGQRLREEAPSLIAALPAPPPKPAVPAGGKAKAAKGKGRAPIVKGQPKPYKKRQGR